MNNEKKQQRAANKAMEKAYIKESFKSDEQTLESLFHLERFYKKHRLSIYAVIIIVVVGILGFVGYSYYDEYKSEKVSSAYNVYIDEASSPEQKSAALKTIASYNKDLSALIAYSNAMGLDDDAKSVNKAIEILEGISSKNPAINTLKDYEIATLKADPKLLSEIKGLSSFAKLQAAYILLQKGDVINARLLLSRIKEKEFAPFVSALSHYRADVKAGTSKAEGGKEVQSKIDSTKAEVDAGKVVESKPDSTTAKTSEAKAVEKKPDQTAAKEDSK